MASPGVDLLIGKIVSLLENEASLLAGVRDELGDLQSELESMRSFLLDAERRSQRTEQTESQRTCVSQVRDTALEIEEIISEFNYYMNKQKASTKFNKCLYQASHLPKNLWVKHKIATKIQKIKKITSGISDRRQRYVVVGLDQGLSKQVDDTNWLRTHNESSLFLKDDDYVGFEDAKEKLHGWLLSGESQRTVISIWGMGGSGKTTLVANAFNNQNINHHFHCTAWITVSQTYGLEDILRAMIKEFNKSMKEEKNLSEDLSNMTYRLLLEKLVNYLQSKSYLVVLDDVWTTELWRQINVALQHGLEGSRVVLTTRHEDVASFGFGLPSHVYHIRPLTEKEAWSLFLTKAFSKCPDQNCPPEIEAHALQLVQKCEGLPLAIVALGSLLSTKNNLESEWRRVLNTLSWELSNNPELKIVKSILLLSFNDLSYQLKHCLLYCSIFPEDYLMRRTRLIKLWVAEGFIQVVDGATPEEVAEMNLMGLIHRSMLQVVERNPYGRPKACKLHDVLREILLQIVSEERFCTIYRSPVHNDQQCKGPRLSIQLNNQRETTSLKGLSKVSSFFMFIAETDPSASFNNFPSGFKLLGILDLEGLPIHKLPVNLDRLLNLTYLNLAGTKVKELPNSIGKLHQLRTLDLKRTDIRVLPPGISELKKLCHLIAYGYPDDQSYSFNYVYGVRAMSNICMLKDLHVLTLLEVEGDRVRQLRNLTNLRRLGLINLRETDEKDLCSAIEQMKSLKYICFITANEDEVLRLDALSWAPTNLTTLFLTCKLEKLPHWFPSLANLKRLLLNWTRSQEDLLPKIQALPNLAFLVLIRAYTGKQLYFGAGFKKLTELQLLNFPELKQIIIEEGAMPCLEQLYIETCKHLRRVPNGIEYLTSLKELFVADASAEFIENVNGEDSARVQHIPRRIIY
ncbi:Disease resistance protein [Quillaja saponaria]|uniref:Disease resistance protein n=1 Tax=Quillaja saponaria TaxID=32244 RepID=A0AAD7L3E1_QUISA|nr:Disease resistance protein [Quillaja saponaria]